MSSKAATVTVPWLVGPASGDVEWLALPTGRPLCEVTVSFSDGATDRSRCNEELEEHPRLLTELPHAVRESLMELLSDAFRAKELAKLRVTIGAFDSWVACERPGLFARPPNQIAITAVALAALGTLPPRANIQLSDDAIALRAAESVVGTPRAPFFKHWALAALSRRPTLAATYPGESCIECEPPGSLPSVLILSGAAVGPSQASAETSRDVKAKAIRLVRASRGDASLLRGNIGAVMTAFRSAPYASSTMSASAAAYPLQTAVEGLAPTGVPGVFLLPPSTEQRYAERLSNIELVLRAHATEYRIFS